MYEPPQYTPDGWPLLFPEYTVEVNECIKCGHPSTHHSIDYRSTGHHYICIGDPKNGDSHCDCIAENGDFKPRRVKK